MRDFARHNEEVRRVWEAYEARRPIRVPVGRFTIGPRIWLMIMKGERKRDPG